jgi:hypothetical protein
LDDDERKNSLANKQFFFFGGFKLETHKILKRGRVIAIAGGLGCPT